MFGREPSVENVFDDLSTKKTKSHPKKEETHPKLLLYPVCSNDVRCVSFYKKMKNVSCECDRLNG